MQYSDNAPRNDRSHQELLNLSEKSNGTTPGQSAESPDSLSHQHTTDSSYNTSHHPTEKTTKSEPTELTRNIGQGEKIDGRIDGKMQLNGVENGRATLQHTAPIERTAPFVERVQSKGPSIVQPQTPSESHHLTEMTLFPLNPVVESSSHQIETNALPQKPNTPPSQPPSEISAPVQQTNHDQPQQNQTPEAHSASTPSTTSTPSDDMAHNDSTLSVVSPTSSVHPDDSSIHNEPMTDVEDNEKSPEKPLSNSPGKPKPSAINTKHLKSHFQDSNFSPLTPASASSFKLPLPLESEHMKQEFKDSDLLDPVYDGIEMGASLRDHRGQYRAMAKGIEVYDNAPFSFAYEQLRSVERSGLSMQGGSMSVFALQENLSKEQVSAKLREMWEVAYICYVCKVMRPLLKFMHFDPDHLERAFLNPEEADNSDLLADIHIRLAKGPVIDKRSREILLEPELEQWVSILRNKLDYLQQNFPQSATWSVNPLKTCSYTKLSPFIRVLILKALCDWKLLTKTQRFMDLLKRMDDANELRMQPLAYNNEGSVFWYFGPEVGRLYLETPPRRLLNGKVEQGSWKLVCHSVDGFKQYLSNNAESQDPGVRRIMDNIERFIIQDILSYQEEKEKKMKEREHKIEEKLRMRQQAIHDQEQYVVQAPQVEMSQPDTSEDLKKKQLKMARAERQKAREQQKKLLELQEQSEMYVQQQQYGGHNPYSVPRGTTNRLGSFNNSVGGVVSMGNMDRNSPKRGGKTPRNHVAMFEEDEDGRPKKKRKGNDDDDFIPEDMGDEDDEIFQQEMELQEEKERKRLSRKGVFQKTPPPSDNGSGSFSSGGIVNFTSPHQQQHQQAFHQFQNSNNKRPFNPQFSPFTFGGAQQQTQQQQMSQFPQANGPSSGVVNMAQIGGANNFGGRLPTQQQQQHGGAQQQNAGLLNQVNLLMHQMRQQQQQQGLHQSPPQHFSQSAQQTMYHQSPPQQQQQQQQRMADPYLTSSRDSFGGVKQQQGSNANRPQQQQQNAFSSPHQFPGGMYRNDTSPAQPKQQEQSRNEYFQQLIQQQQSLPMHQINAQQGQLHPSQLQQLQQMHMMRQMQQQQQQGSNLSPQNGTFPFQQQQQQQQRQQGAQQQQQPSLQDMQFRMQQQRAAASGGNMMRSGQQASQQQHPNMNAMSMGNFAGFPNFGHPPQSLPNKQQQNQQQQKNDQQKQPSQDDNSFLFNFGSF